MRLDGNQFVECDWCRTQPGSPELCSGCLHNRALIERLNKTLEEEQSIRPPWGVVTLSEREWDHVVLALESSEEWFVEKIAKCQQLGLTSVGARRAGKRFGVLLDKIVDQLGWGGGSGVIPATITFTNAADRDRIEGEWNLGNRTNFRRRKGDHKTEDRSEDAGDQL